MATAEVPNDGATHITGVGFEAIIDEVRADFIREEKTRRHTAYRDLGKVVTDLLATEDAGQALHRTFLEVDGDPIERTIFVCRGAMPDHGSLVRAILNDESRGDAMGGRSMDIKDFMISTTQKMLTYQRTKLERQPQDLSWNLNEGSGPLLQRRHDSLNVISGSGYDVLVPKTKGYPQPLSALMSDRFLIEGLVENLTQLNETTAEVGYPSQLGIMS